MQDKVDKLSLSEKRCCRFDLFTENAFFTIPSHKSFSGIGLAVTWQWLHRVQRSSVRAMQLVRYIGVGTRPTASEARSGRYFCTGEKVRMIPNPSLVALSLACIPITLGMPARLDAAENTPIYAAANDYRAAVRRFESQVLRTPSVRKAAERTVDCLESSTSGLKTAARDPERFDRLYRRFVQTEAFHARVELIFFGNPLYPPDPLLDECWSVVAQAHSRLVQEILYLKTLRQSRRGDPLPIVDHRADFVPGPIVGPVGASFSTLERDSSLYRSEYAPTFPSETFQLDPKSTPQGNRPARSGDPTQALTTRSGDRTGVLLQRDSGGVLRTPPVRIRITTREQLRSAVIGAMLQRK
jgi:hypothetical protein